MVVRVPAQIADRDPGVLPFMPDHFAELATPLFGERWHRHADQLALRNRVEPQVGFANCLLDHLGHLLFPRRNSDRARINQGDAGNLVDRDFLAVIVDLDMVEQSRMCTPGTHFREIGFQRLDRLLHLLLGRLLDLSNIHWRFSPPLYAWTNVPSSAPVTIRFNAPRLYRLNTMIGSFWSRHSARAVASITPRFFVIASSNVSR